MQHASHARNLIQSHFVSFADFVVGLLHHIKFVVVYFILFLPFTIHTKYTMTARTPKSMSEI